MLSRIRPLVAQLQASSYAVQHQSERIIVPPAKLGTVLEEADESLYWLELIRDGELMLDSKVSLLLTEADELTAILAAGRKSAASNRTSNIEHLT